MINFFKRFFGIEDPKPQVRLYSAARINRLNRDWIAYNTSADAEINASLRLLRARSRQVMRDNAHAANAKRIIINNVVGAGIGMQAQVMTGSGKLNERINEKIESAWLDWCQADQCHTAGILPFPDMLQMIVGQVVECGEIIVRKVKQPFGKSKIPFALEIIEPDQLADEYTQVKLQNGNTVRMGVEVDKWQRPVAYYLYPNHPGDIVFKHVDPSTLIRVPADEIYHLYLAERFPQTRGVPWLHAVMEKLNDIGAYERAEIVAARAAANIAGFVTSPEPLTPNPDGERDNRGRIIPTEPGTIQELAPGQTFTAWDPKRPNTAFDPFMRMMLRNVASGMGVSYESLSRDYSQSNYSSSRLALLDDRDRWRVLQQWLIRRFLDPMFKEWMEAAVMSGVLPITDFHSNLKKYQNVRWKPRGWSWIDPAKEVEAYVKAVNEGFMTISDVISLTGSGVDAEDEFKARAAELALLKSMGLKKTEAGLVPLDEPDPEPKEKPAKGNKPQEDDKEDKDE